MAQKFPTDRFDSVPHGLDRVGAHRAPTPRGRGWIAFGIAAAVALVLIAGGIFAIVQANGRLTLAAPPASSAPVHTVPPTIDPKVSVLVLNGTDSQGLAGKASDALKAAGIPVDSTANASENNIAQTVVYYANPALEGAARGVASKLPESEVRMDSKFAQTGTPLVVVLGADYAKAVGG